MPRPFDLIPPLLDGVWITLLLTVGGTVLAAVMAWTFGLAKLSKNPLLRWPAVAYIEVFRGTSALVQLFWFYYALPLLGVNLTAIAAGIIVLGLNIGAYGAEVVRGSVQSIDKGQFEAGTALNMTTFQRMRLIIMPQALVRILPPAGNLLIELLKTTALVSLITLSDLTYEGKLLRDESLRTVEVFAMLLVIYFGIASLMTYGVRRLEFRLKRGWHLETAS
jgi:polar amino acid transport system permease protein